MLLASFISGDYQHASAEPAGQWFDLKPFAAIALRQQVLTFLAPLSCVQRMPMSCCTSVCHDRQRRYHAVKVTVVLQRLPVAQTLKMNALTVCSQFSAC